MPLLDSEAIILRTTPLGEADKLVSFLARALGRMRGVARGARRPRSRFGATLEPLSHVHLWFYDRAQRDLVRLTQSELIHPSSPTDYPCTLAFNHLTELSERLLPEREPSERNFRLLLMVRDALHHRPNIWLPLTYFDLWMVKLAGLLPELDRCNRCGRHFDTDPCYLGLGTAGALCRRCRRPPMRALAAPPRTLAQQSLRHPLSHLPSTPSDRERTQDLRNYLLDVIEHNAEIKLATRELLNALA